MLLKFTPQGTARPDRLDHVLRGDPRFRPEQAPVGKLHLVDQLPDHQISIFPEEFAAEGVAMGEQRSEITLLAGERFRMPQQSVDRIEICETERLLRPDVPVGIEPFLFELILHRVPVGDRRDHQKNVPLLALLHQVVEHPQIGVFHQISGGIGDLPLVHVKAEKIHSEQLEMIQVLVHSPEMLLSQFGDVVEVMVERRIIVDPPERDITATGVTDLPSADMEGWLKRRNFHLNSPV